MNAVIAGLDDAKVALGRIQAGQAERTDPGAALAALADVERGLREFAADD